jgi:peptide/nickel transport system permease protein/oligopeptide transport system permease protein
MSDATLTATEHLSPNQRALRRFIRNKPAAISMVFLALLFVLVIAWPLIAPYSYATVTDRQFQPPSAEHWFGTDVHGRDVMTRVFFGARISLLVGLVGAFVAFVIGVTWGAIAGYVGGRWDNLMMRFVDVLYSLPSILFVIVLVATFNDHLRSTLTKHFGTTAGIYAPMLFLFFGLGAVSWLTMARIVRGQVLSLRNRQFVDASRSLGASHTRILWDHILPNIYGIVIVYLTLTVPSIILYESFLSFLGLGIQPPMASWGTLIAEGAGQINPIRIYWWLLVFPCAMLITTLLALNFLGDGLRDAYDPRGDRA